MCIHKCLTSENMSPGGDTMGMRKDGEERVTKCGEERARKE